jgi:hypothetical protein
VECYVRHLHEESDMEASQTRDYCVAKNPVAFRSLRAGFREQNASRSG